MGYHSQIDCIQSHIYMSCRTSRSSSHALFYSFNSVQSINHDASIQHIGAGRTSNMTKSTSHLCPLIILSIGLLVFSSICISMKVECSVMPCAWKIHVTCNMDQGFFKMKIPLQVFFANTLSFWHVTNAVCLCHAVCNIHVIIHILCEDDANKG